MRRFLEVKGPLHVGSYAVLCAWAMFVVTSGGWWSWTLFGLCFVALVICDLRWTAAYGELKEAHGAATEARLAHERWKQFLRQLQKDREAA